MGWLCWLALWTSLNWKLAQLVMAGLETLQVQRLSMREMLACRLSSGHFADMAGQWMIATNVNLETWQTAREHEFGRRVCMTAAILKQWATSLTSGECIRPLSWN